MTREEAEDHYRRLHAISGHLQGEAGKHISVAALAEQVRRLRLLAIDEDDPAWPPVWDLALHTAKPGRSSALERYARAERPAPGTDEACVLEALRHARFSIWRVDRLHEVAGLALQDLLRGGEVWFMTDPARAAAAPVGGTFAGRLADVGAFVIPCAVAVPVFREVLEEVLDDPIASRGGDLTRLAEHPRFAAALYRAALERGLLDFDDEEA